MTEDNPSKSISSKLHHAAVSTEHAVDLIRRRIWKATGRNQPRQIAAYCGYSDGTVVHVSGRVLANRPGGGPLDEDGWWENLRNTYRRWESDEVAGATLTVAFAGEERVIVSDEEGYYQVTFPAAVQDLPVLGWHTATARIATKEEDLIAVHPILVPAATAEFGVISDMDDTVIHTGVTRMLLAAKLTFLENAKTRKPLDGVSGLYASLQRGHAGNPVNPLFYISSSPWNLYDLLVDFLKLNEIPPGPLLLRDLGLDRTKFIKEKGHRHKQEKALKLIDAYPDLPFVLIGDSGQEDPAIYAEVARQRPGRVKAIYIRDVDPGHQSKLDAAVHRAIDAAMAVDVPMVLAPDSLTMSEHASRIGLIPPSALAGVSSEVKADRERPEMGEQALEDAAESIFTDHPE